MTGRSILILFVGVGPSLCLAACGNTKRGSARRTEGQVKEAAGSVLGDKSLKRQGEKDQAVGGVKDAASDVKEAARNAVN